MILSQLNAVACSAMSNSQKFLPYIDDACAKYNILSPVRQLCFLSQVSHESGGLFYTEELASGAAYEGRHDLGNTNPGDGVRYKGRGLIQITGRSNYKALSVAFDVDFINNPTLLGGKNINDCTSDQLKYAAMSAGWFWSTRNLNIIADKINMKYPPDVGPNLNYFKQITKRINGGYKGLADRLHRYKEGSALFSSNPALLKTTS